MPSTRWTGWQGHRGHFYNWYDTRSLNPLPPHYISTVDSGNLAAHLLTLRQGLVALPDHKILGVRWLEGLGDTLGILADAAGDAPPAQLSQRQASLASENESRPSTLAAAFLCLDRLAKSSAGVVSDFEAAPESPALWWARAFARQCQVARDELTYFAPWIALPAIPDGLSALPGTDEMPSLRELAGL